MKHGEFGNDDAPPGFVVVGAIGAPHGVRGHSRLWSYTDPPENLFDYDGWRLGRNGAGRSDRSGSDAAAHWQAVEVEDVRWHGNGFVGRIEGCSDRNAAAALTNLLIAVPESALPAAAPDEVYWKDLIGLNCVNRLGTSLGQVEKMLETGANEVLCLRDDDGLERLVPWVPSVVLELDLEAGRLTVDWDPDY